MGYARLVVGGTLVHVLGERVGLSPHQTNHYRAIWTVHDAPVADSATLTVAAVLDAGRARMARFDDQRVQA